MIYVGDQILHHPLIAGLEHGLCSTERQGNFPDSSIYNIADDKYVEDPHYYSPGSSITLKIIENQLVFLTATVDIRIHLLTNTTDHAYCLHSASFPVQLDGSGNISEKELHPSYPNIPSF